MRAELIRGDIRPAYLACLLAVQTGDVAEDKIELPVPAGLSTLTAGQSALVEFLAEETRSKREHAEALAKQKAKKAAARSQTRARSETTSRG